MTTTSVASIAAHPPTVVVADLNAGKVPVLFVDTCALLDIVRAPCRDQTEALLNSVYRLETALRQSRAVLCASETTRDEWRRNIENVVEEVKRAGQKADKTVQQFELAARILGSPSSTRAAIASLRVPEELHSCSERMLNLATLVSTTPSVKDAAWVRQAEALRPAKRGKDSHGDCTIVETLFAVGSGLDATTCPLVFLTSNTTDFADNGTLHSDLVSEFQRVGATATFNWAWALHELGI